MTIEELKAEWERSRSLGPDCSDSEFAQKYMDKLLAVAKAAEQVNNLLASYTGPTSDQLRSALNNLLEEE